MVMREMLAGIFTVADDELLKLFQTAWRRPLTCFGQRGARMFPRNSSKPFFSRRQHWVLASARKQSSAGNRKPITKPSP